MTLAGERRLAALLSAPRVPLGRWRPGRVLERNVMVARYSWLVIFSGFFDPVFYLFSLGVGLGELVGSVPGPHGGSVSYREFVAPALMAASAMNGAVYESTMNVFYKLRHARVYDALLATPMSPGDVARGEITWCLLRGGLYGTGFLLVMAAMGLIGSWWALMALPAVLLIGFAFAACGMAFTSYVRTWADFELVQLAVVLMFLFSATFYPLGVYPRGLQLVVQATPLFHGVTLVRALTAGAVGPGLLVHLAYLVTMGAVGLAITGRRFARLLLP
ncbi:MAG: ABC transporter permease [Acidimicrobiia bacterium]